MQAFFIRRIFLLGIRSRRILNALRAAYLEAGGSPHNDLHRTYIDNLEHAIPEVVANGTRFYLAFLDTAPHPDDMAIKAINEGASKIIVFPIFVTESTHTIAGQEMVDSVNPQQYGVEVSYTGALGKSDSLHNVFVDRANDMSIDLDKSDVGIYWSVMYSQMNGKNSIPNRTSKKASIAPRYVIN